MIHLAQGDIYIQFFSEKAPKHVQNFIKLAEEGFYNGTTFHRIEPRYIIQGGDPKSKDKNIYNDGTGSLDYQIPSEFYYPHFRGAVAMAKKPLKYNPNNESSACQFYIALDSLPNLDKEKYTVFARVISGFSVLDSLTKLDYVDGTNPNSNWNKVTEMKVEISYLQDKPLSER